MSEETSNPPPSSTNTLLLPRREPFDHGLLPIPKLIFTDGTITLTSIKNSLLSKCKSKTNLVDAQTIAESLQISTDAANLVVEILTSLLPWDCPNEEAEKTVNVYDLLLFLYVQSYKRLGPRPSKDAAAVADVWPSMSAFDGYLSAMSPLQLVRSNSRRFMPSQADEEAHQLSYLEKHMANILTLLSDSLEGENDESLLVRSNSRRFMPSQADEEAHQLSYLEKRMANTLTLLSDSLEGENDESLEGENDESLVLTFERFRHLEFLIKFVENGCEVIPFSQAVPFFANSDLDMPAVPAAQVLEWVLNNISTSLERVLEKSPTKENGSTNAANLDITDADASMNNCPSFSRSQAFVEGIFKASVIKQACDIKGNSIKILNCHDSVIYVLAPLKYATVYGCCESTIILGAVGKAVRVEHCERVQIITAAKRICIANCRECVFFLGVNQQPLIIGDNPKLQVAPYNTFYPQLEEHMAQVGVNATVNRWNEPYVLGAVDPHDSISHAAGVTEVQPQSAMCLDPDQFTIFPIPKLTGADEPTQPTKDNPFPLPESYMASLKKTQSVLNDIQQVLRNAQLEENRKQDLACALHVHFRDWLYASGNIRQLYYLQGD